MATNVGGNTQVNNAFRKSVMNLPTDKLEDLYLGYRVKKMHAYMNISLPVISITLSIFATLAGSFAAGIGFAITTVGLGAYSFLQIHKNAAKQKVVEDLFQERRIQTCFQSRLGGLGGFSLVLTPV